MAMRDYTQMSVEQLRDVIVLSECIVAAMTAADELRRRDVPVGVPLGRSGRMLAR